LSQDLKSRTFQVSCESQTLARELQFQLPQQIRYFHPQCLFEADHLARQAEPAVAVVAFRATAAVTSRRFLARLLGAEYPLHLVEITHAVHHSHRWFDPVARQYLFRADLEFVD